MRIKSDFVTNSSSTMYIVFLPKDYFPNNNVLTQSAHNHMMYEGEYIPGELQREVNNELLDYLKGEIGSHLDYLETEGELWTYGRDQGVNPYIYCVLLECLEKDGLVLKNLEMSGEGNNRIIAIQHSMLKEMYMEESLKELNLEKINEE